MPDPLDPSSTDARPLPAAFAVDPEEAEEVRARRRRDYALRRIPLVRAVGFGLMALVVALHNRLVPGAGTGRQSLLFAAAAAPYCLLSWLSLRAWHGRTRVDLLALWQWLDGGLRILSIYWSGGPGSWMFPVLLTGIYDNVLVSFRQTFGGMAVTVGLYLAMLAWILGVDGGVVPWGQEFAKLAVLVATGLYLLSNARLAEQLREQRRQAVQLARDLIRHTREQAEALDAARVQAEQHSRAKSQFLAGMSHELRTPLNTILLYSELLEAEAKEAPEGTLADEPQRIKSAGRHLLQLVNDLLDLSKVEAGKMDLNREACSLRVLGEEAAAAVEALMVRGSNHLVLDLPEGPDGGMLDPLRVRQILINLLGNAAKFTDRGTITLRARRDGEACVFEVSDTGIGMTSEQVGRIFRDFAQAGPDTAQKYGGTGLGLSLSKKLCELMEGTIEVESEPGRGSTFRVRIPDQAA